MTQKDIDIKKPELPWMQVGNQQVLHPFLHQIHLVALLAHHGIHPDHQNVVCRLQILEVHYDIITNKNSHETVQITWNEQLIRTCYEQLIRTC